MPANARRLLATARLAVVLTAWLPWRAAAQPTAGWPANTSACIACHATGSAATPRLAGLPADYLVKQLRDLRDGDRPADAALRAAHALDREAARRVAQALAVLPAAGWPASGSTPGRLLYEQGNQRQGRPACQVCHGSATGQAPGMSAPPLQGQPAGYLAQQLHAWRDHSRRNSPDDMMTDAAAPLTDAEIDALARHLGRP
jgi:cytochrome c553